MDGEFRRRVQARDVLTQVLPANREVSPGRPIRQRRSGVNARSMMSGRTPSGQDSPTTTAKGHIIVPASKARVIAINIEQAPRSQSPVLGNSGNVRIPGEDEFNKTYDSVRKSSLEERNDSETKSNFVAAFSMDSVNNNNNRNVSVEHLTLPAKVKLTNDDNNNEFENDSVFKTRKDNCLNGVDPPRGRFARVRNGDRNLQGYGDKTIPIRGYNSSDGSSSIPRDVQIDRSSHVSTNVTYSNQEVSSQIAALRKEYVIRKQGNPERNYAEYNDQNKPNTSKRHAAKSESKPSGRRRRGNNTRNVVVQSNQLPETPTRNSSIHAVAEHRFAKTSVKSSLTSSTQDSSGDKEGIAKSNTRKHSPYLPMYIQPVEKPHSSYHQNREPHRMRFDRDNSSLEAKQNSKNALISNHIESQRAVGRNNIDLRRKISTDMNKYDSSSSSSGSSSRSSSSSSSSSSDTEVYSPKDRPSGAKDFNQDFVRLTDCTLTATPESSDFEKRCQEQEGRRRRIRRSRNANHDPIQRQFIANTEEGLRASKPRGRTARHRRTGDLYHQSNNMMPVMEDKYVTLPDNYKISEAFAKEHLIGCSNDGKNKVNVNQKSQVDDRSEGHNEARKQTSERIFVATKSSNHAGGRSEPISSNSSLCANKIVNETSKLPRRFNEEKLIIADSNKASQLSQKEVVGTVGQISSPTDLKHVEDQLNSPSVIVKHVDLSDVTNKTNSTIGRTSQSIFTEEKPASTYSRARRNSSCSSEGKVVGDIRSIFENPDAPKGDVGQSYINKKEQNSQGTSKAYRTTKEKTQDCVDNAVVVQSQPKIKARKVSEDYWPRDEATVKLLSRKTFEQVTSPPEKTNNYEISPITMQETIDELQKFVADDTEYKSRSNSSTDLQKPTEADNVPLSTSVESDERTSLQKSAQFKRKGSNTGSRPLANVSKLQMVKKLNYDMSPCMSSTETLKGYSSGEYQGRNSRSHSIDSIASNPETVLLNKGNGNHIKEKNIQQGSLSQSSSLDQDNNNDFLIVEGSDSCKSLSGEVSSPKENELDNKVQSATNQGVLSKSSQKSMIMQMRELTASLRRFKLTGPPQPLSSPSPPWEKAVTMTDPILSVSPRGNVTCLSSNLETLNEHPEPPSPDLEITQKSKSHSVFSEFTDNVGESESLMKQSNLMIIKQDSLDIDEGIVTEEEMVTRRVIYDCSAKLEAENRKRRKHTTSETGTSNSENNRSHSDPLPTRKKNPYNKNTSLDSNMLLAFENIKPLPMGSPDQQSISSLSVFSEQISIDSYQDPSMDDKLGKGSQKNNKKKSLSDPNPIRLDAKSLNGDAEAIQEDTFPSVYTASSEPNVMEQCDKLGDLEQFKIYQTSKVSLDAGPGIKTANNRTKSLNQPTDTVFDSNHGLISPRNGRGKVSLKARKRAENGASVNVEDSKSIIGQLLAAQKPNNHTPRYQDQEGLSPQSSSTVGPLSSTELYLQRSGPTPDLLENEEQQFFQILESMTGKDEYQQDKIAHSRSSSLPVDLKNSQFDEYYGKRPSVKERRPGIIQAPSLDSVTTAEVAVKAEIPTEKPKQQPQVHDMRLHVVKNLLETEESYVASLQILFEDYMKPLKHPDNHSICEPRLVDEMFHKIPQLLQHHDRFMENVQECYHDWNYRDVKLGDLFLNSFNKDALLETYTSYIKNYLNAREAVRTAMLAKVAFKSFIEQCQSKNKDKQGLSDLMIKPVQRIPRYELIIKDLLKHTPEGHQDRAGLLIAQREIHTLAEQMNRSEKEAEAAERHARLLQDIEQIIEGSMDLCVPKRRFVRQDIIAELKAGNKKDRSLWLFNDLIMCTTTKKGRGTYMRRSSNNLWTLGQDRVQIDFNNKYKFLWKFPLEDVEHLQGNGGPARQTVEKQMQILQSDLEILMTIYKQADQLSCNHMQLDDCTKDLVAQIRRQLTDKQQISFHSTNHSGRIELGITTGDGVKTFLFEFPSEDTKVQFEIQFGNAKRNLSTQKNRWEPVFMKAIPISKTRSGMQFSCAAPNADTSPLVREVWVCNTDGYVGQVCFLSLESEPIQTQCITVCHTKICCIAQVPTSDRKLVPTSTLLQEISTAPLIQTHDRRFSSSASNPAQKIISWDDTDESDEENTSPWSTVSPFSASPYSTNNSTTTYDEDLSVPALSPLVTSPFIRKHFEFSPTESFLASLSSMVPFSLDDSLDNIAQASEISSMPGFTGTMGNSLEPGIPTFRNGAAWKKGSDGLTTHGSLEELLTDEKVSGAAQAFLTGKDSMWLGTEDGKIHIYPQRENSSDVIRAGKDCVKLSHGAPVHCILYHENQVFVALSNGDLVIYSRDVSGQWDFKTEKTISKVSGNHAITKMVIVGKKELWCGCQNLIKIIDLTSQAESSHFSVSQDNKRLVYCMVCCGYGVWVALDRRAQIKLFHTVTHDPLIDIDVSNPVSKMLASSDAIIRQHKAACLRITALLVCKDLLWVGTSAGVVLTLALPNITSGTSSLPLPIMPQGLAYGHTGHVRFLTAVEITDKEQGNLSRGNSRRASNPNKRRPSASAASGITNRTTTLVISGGDGYEDFRMNSTSESAGREDSTNHLLLWKA